MEELKRWAQEMYDVYHQGMKEETKESDLNFYEGLIGAYEAVLMKIDQLEKVGK